MAVMFFPAGFTASGFLLVFVFLGGVMLVNNRVFVGVGGVGFDGGVGEVYAVVQHKQ